MAVSAFRFIDPCSPVLAKAVPTGADWLHEVKFDGYRVQAHKAGKDVVIFSRNGHDFSSRFADIAYVLINPHSVEPAVGASGAICGVFAAYFLAVRPTPRAALADPRVRNAMLTFVGINVVLVALLPLPIAWEAHLGGFIAGALVYLALARWAPAGPWG